MSATAEQARIVEAALDGPHLVDAGAGTGKTFTLVERAAALVESGAIRSDQLLVVTFTKAAAAEIATRLEARLPRETKPPTCGTFHQIAAAIVREFAYVTGDSPDLRVIDDFRARGLFARAFTDLLAGRLDVDTSALPLLDRTEALAHNLATIALRLKSRGGGIERFESEALAAADALAALPFGAVAQLGAKRQTLSGWPQPDPPLTPEERAEEAERERRNIRAIAALFRRFNGLLAAEALLTFGDVLTRATALLDAHPAIAQHLRERWRHAMVDEFQDTNDVQVGFLEALFGKDLRPVLAVGDLRQAIYAFNGANPEGILRFAELTGCERHPLTVNRRSYQPILDLAHDALAAAGAVPAERHARLAAARGHSPRASVRVQLFTGEETMAREAEAIARTARRLVDDGVAPKQIAVLLRSRTKAGVYAGALRAHGLAVQMHGGAGFFDAEEIRELVAWLRLVERPDERDALVLALQSRTVGLGDGVLARLAEEADFARAALLGPLDPFSPQERARLERFRAIVRTMATLADVPLADAVRTVVRESGIELARLDGDEGVLDQTRANLDKFVRLAADLAADRPAARIADLIAELDARALLEIDEAEAELDGERVALMTIHAAKGLEWSHVFVANVSPQSFPLQNSGMMDTVVLVDERRGALAFKHTVTGRQPLRWLLATKHVDETTGEVLKQPFDDREEQRLFYVALTRARDVVYITGRLRPDRRDPSSCLQSVLRWCDEQGIPHGEVRLVADVPADELAPRQPELTAPAVSADEIARRLIAQLAREAAPPAPAVRVGTLSYTAIALHESCPRRARYHYVLGLPDLNDESPVEAGYDHDAHDEHDTARRDPARFGRIVHRVLERHILARMSGAARALEAWLEEALNEEDCSGEAVLREGALAAARSAIPLLAPFTPLNAERRFDLTLEGVALGGYIDLLARDADGRLAVIDYKTGLTPGDHYALQFALYRHAVRTELDEDPQTLLLRLAAGTATLEPVVASDDATLRASVRAASTMAGDEPRPGVQCRSCPYAGAICEAYAERAPADRCRKER